MAATSKMGLQYSENLCETKLKKNVGLAKKVLKVEYYCSPMIRKENMLRRNLSVVANSSGDMINGKMLHGIHVGDDPYVGKKISSTDACMLGKFVEGRLLAEHVHHVVQHFMMWYNTLTTSSTIPFPLRLKSTFVIRSCEIDRDKMAHGNPHESSPALNYVSSSGLAGNGFGTTREMSLRKLIRVVTRIHIQVEKYSFWGDVVEIDTWLDAAGKNGVRRDWIIRDCNTQKIITRATGTWVIMNSETRRLCKIPEQVREEIQPFYLNRLAMAAAQNHNEKIEKLTDETACWKNPIRISSKMERHGCQPPRHQCRICWSPWQA
ncbi:hypothetical protein AAG906_013911 [Vitis piasezkii]